MRKIIVSRFAGKCSVCKGAVNAGDRVYWLGKGKGIQHITCRVENPDVAEKQDTGNVVDGTVKFTEVRDRFRNAVNDKASDFTMNRGVMEWLKSSHWEADPHWTGCTMSDMENWLSNGFTVDGLAGVDSSLFPAKPRRRIIFAEEGDEMLIDLARNGDDKHWIEWEKRMIKPGLQVEIGCTFSASFPAEIIVKYQRWVARMLQSLDEAAIDCQVNIYNRASNVFTDGPYDETNFTRIRVKESGEASDIAAWSAMFSPGGFRQLMFTAKIMQADSLGRPISRGLGSPRYAPEWTVAYDAESNILSIANPGNSSEFPEYEMTEKFKAVLDQISGG